MVECDWSFHVSIVSAVEYTCNGNYSKNIPCYFTSTNTMHTNKNNSTNNKCKVVVVYMQVKSFMKWSIKQYYYYIHIHNGPLVSHYQHSTHCHLLLLAGQEHATFSGREDEPLHEHHCCQSLLYMADDSGRIQWSFWDGFKLCVPGAEWVA